MVDWSSTIEARGYEHTINELNKKKPRGYVVAVIIAYHSVLLAVSGTVLARFLSVGRPQRRNGAT
jgi:hypothetical protein